MTEPVFEAKYRDWQEGLKFSDLIRSLARIYTCSEPNISLEIGEDRSGNYLLFTYSGEYTHEGDIKEKRYKTKMSARFDGDGFGSHLYRPQPLQFQFAFEPFFRHVLDITHPPYPFDRSFLIEDHGGEYVLQVTTGDASVSLPLTPGDPKTASNTPPYPALFMIPTIRLTKFVEYAILNGFRQISFHLEYSKVEQEALTLRCDDAPLYVETRLIPWLYQFHELPDSQKDIPLKDGGDFSGELSVIYPLMPFEPILLPMDWGLDGLWIWIGPEAPLLIQRGLSTRVRQWIESEDKIKPNKYVPSIPERGDKRKKDKRK